MGVSLRNHSGAPGVLHPTLSPAPGLSAVQGSCLSHFEPILPRFTRSWVGPAVSRYTAVGELHCHSYGSFLCAKLVLDAEDRLQVEQESLAVSGLESEGLQERLAQS